MQITVTGRHATISERLKEHAREKVSKLPRFYDRIRSIDVILSHDSGEFVAEIIVKADRADPFVARESGADMSALIDMLIDKLGRQLRRHKERLRNRKHSGGKLEPAEEE